MVFERAQYGRALLPQHAADELSLVARMGRRKSLGLITLAMVGLVYQPESTLDSCPSGEKDTMLTTVPIIRCVPRDGDSVRSEYFQGEPTSPAELQLFIDICGNERTVRPCSRL